MACYLPVDGGGLRRNFEVGYARERSRGTPAAEANEQDDPPDWGKDVDEGV